MRKPARSRVCAHARALQPSSPLLRTGFRQRPPVLCELVPMRVLTAAGGIVLPSTVVTRLHERVHSPVALHAAHDSAALSSTCLLSEFSDTVAEPSAVDGILALAPILVVSAIVLYGFSQLWAAFSRKF